MWNMKYLKGFKWANLTEQQGALLYIFFNFIVLQISFSNVQFLFNLGMIYIITAYRRAVRDNRVRTEMNQAKKETQDYLAKAEKAKTFEAIEKKREVGDFITSSFEYILKKKKLTFQFN